MGDTRECCACAHRALRGRAGLTLRVDHVAVGTHRCRRRADPRQAQSRSTDAGATDCRTIAPTGFSTGYERRGDGGSNLQSGERIHVSRIAQIAQRGQQYATVCDAHAPALALPQLICCESSSPQPDAKDSAAGTSDSSASAFCASTLEGSCEVHLGSAKATRNAGAVQHSACSPRSEPQRGANYCGARNCCAVQATRREGVSVHPLCRSS